MTLAVILGICALLGSPYPGGYVSAGQTAPAQQAPDTNSQQNSKDPKPPDQSGQQAPPAEAKPQEQPAEQQAKPPQEQPAEQQPAQPAPNNVPAQPPSEAAPEKPAEKLPEKPAAGKTKRRSAKKKPGTSGTTSSTLTQASSEPRRIVVRDGSAADPKSQLTPGMSPAQASNSRQITNQLLASTQENLKRTSGRVLTANEQAMVDQIRAFITQANAALKTGDLQRGHNLAVKAHLLSDDLLRHR